MKNFCTDIQEMAKLRGLVKGEPCRIAGYREPQSYKYIEPKDIATSSTVININLGDILEKGIEGDITININL